jgi:hypothetical protein
MKRDQLICLNPETGELNYLFTAEFKRRGRTFDLTFMAKDFDEAEALLGELMQTIQVKGMLLKQVPQYREDVQPIETSDEPALPVESQKMENCNKCNTKPILVEKVSTGEHYVKCLRCKATGPKTIKEKQAIKLWNDKMKTNRMNSLKGSLWSGMSKARDGDE